MLIFFVKLLYKLFFYLFRFLFFFCFLLFVSLLVGVVVFFLFLSNFFFVCTVLSNTNNLQTDLFSPIFSFIYGTIPSRNTPVKSRAWSNSNEGVLHTSREREPHHQMEFGVILLVWDLPPLIGGYNQRILSLTIRVSLLLGRGLTPSTRRDTVSIF